MQILLVIDDIAQKKLGYTLKSSTQAKLFPHFPFFYFISLQVEKKFTLQLFAFVNLLVAFWWTRNNNESTKRIILQPPQRQISKKLLNNRVNAFTVKKYMWHLQQFFCRKKHMLPSGKKFFKKIATRCDWSKILYANKLCKKPDRVIPAQVAMARTRWVTFKCWKKCITGINLHQTACHSMIKKSYFRLF